MKKNKELTENKEEKGIIIARLLQLIEINSITLQDYYNIDSPKSITKQYKDLIKRYSHELAEVVGFKMKGNKLSQMECVELFIAEKTKIGEVEKQLKIQEDRKRKDSESGKDNIILMLDAHRNFAKDSLFGSFRSFESEGFKKIKCSELIDFTFFSRVMVTDEIINSYCGDTRVSNFTSNLIERYEYYGEDLEWNISIIEIEILFNVLRENQFIAPDTPRNIFFEIFNPNLSMFVNPIVWQDVKELGYFLDKCREYSLLLNFKYQSIVERCRMFKSNLSGDFLTASSISSTLSDVKDKFGNYSENQKFITRMKKFDELFREMGYYSEELEEICC